MENSKINPLYESLSPWAEADPVPLKGLTAERPKELAGKTIGLFHNFKRASRPILDVLERELKSKFPTATLSRYAESLANTPETESPNKDRFEEWLKSLDTVIFAYGD